MAEYSINQIVLPNGDICNLESGVLSAIASTDTNGVIVVNTGGTTANVTTCYIATLSEIIDYLDSGIIVSNAVSVVDEQDTNGGTIRHITGVSLQNDTVTAAHLESGYTAHDAAGNAIIGTLTVST